MIHLSEPTRARVPNVPELGPGLGATSARGTARSTHTGSGSFLIDGVGALDS